MWVKLNGVILLVQEGMHLRFDTKYLNDLSFYQLICKFDGCLLIFVVTLSSMFKEPRLKRDVKKAAGGMRCKSNQNCNLGIIVSMQIRKGSFIPSLFDFFSCFWPFREAVRGVGICVECSM